MNRSKGLRVLVGLAALAVVLTAGFSVLRPWVPTWGSTAAERARSLPGDAIAEPPLVDWTHGITVRAAPEAVWPWIAQLGDVRGGFYSYTFIENFIAREQMYRNADRIIPELQIPAPGTGMIMDFLQMREIVPARHLLAALELPEMRMSWVWALYPREPGHTRLVVRMRGHPDLKATALLMGVATFFVNYGGFVMERKMMQGIKDRAEGRSEPPWVQGVEIALWLLVFGLGAVAAVACVGRGAWWRGLATGLAAAALLFFLSFGQPPLWIRGLLLLLLAAGVAWAYRSEPLGRRR
jgi:hypothetical protein